MEIDTKPDVLALTEEEKKVLRRKEERSLLWKIDLLRESLSLSGSLCLDVQRRRAISLCSV